MITLFIFCQHNKMPTALVLFTFPFVHRTMSHVHLASDDRLEQFSFGFFYLRPAFRQFFLLVLALYLTAFYTGYALLQVFYLALGAIVFLIDIVGEFLDAEHVSMVGHRDPLHSVFHGFIHQLTDAGLTIKQRILGVYMQMNKILHNLYFLFSKI